jgi:hypothetical protein
VIRRSTPAGVIAYRLSVVVNAKSHEDALLKVKQDYRNEVHVLDSSHHSDTEFSVDLRQRARDMERDDAR